MSYRNLARPAQLRAVIFGTTALVAASLGLALPAAAQNTWNANPDSSDFNTPANWTPPGVPFIVATFKESSVTTLTFSGARNLDAFQFDAGAPAYTFNLSGFGLNFAGDGIVNNSSNAPTFNVASSSLIFDGDSSAGNAIINLTAGTVQFMGASTPGAAQLNAVNAGTAFDFTGISRPISAGSIAGAGDFQLGGNALTVGGNNLSTSVSGVISDGSLVKTGTGTLSLSGANIYGGGTTISGGTIAAAHVDGLGNIDALGTGDVTLDGGALRIDVSGSLANGITFNDNKTSVLSAGAQNVSLDGSVFLGTNATAQFGLAGDTGTIVLNAPPSADTSNKVIIAGGTLQDGGNTLVGLTFFASTQVNAGATLDFNDAFNQAVRNLSGLGSVVTGTVGGTTLGLIVDSTVTTTFGGVISGPGAVIVQSLDPNTGIPTPGGTMIFTGANTYTGGTTICECATFQLGTLTTPGSIIKNVTVEGTLNIVNSDTSAITKINNIFGGATHFFNATSASAAVIVNNDGSTTFHDTSSAGTADITNRNFGELNFLGSSTAAQSTITNRVDGTTNFSGMSRGGTADITNNGGITNFIEQSSAGNATITNRNFGELNFLGSSTAAQSTITNRFDGTTNFSGMSRGGTADITNNGGITNFIEQSSAGNATITNRNGGETVFGTFGGTDTASAGNATIINRETGGATTFQALTTAGAAKINNNGGITSFFDSANAGSANITNRNGGAIFFVDNTSAANATIVNRDGSGFPSVTIFGGTSDAGTANITNQDIGITFFTDGASAANATITNNAFGAVAFGIPFGTDAPTAANATITTNADGVTTFQAFSTAANATIITNNGGTTIFFDNSTGGNARFVANGTGIVDFSNSIGPNGDGKITAGSIEGSGKFFIGTADTSLVPNNTLIVGSNNLSTEVSGVIADFDPCGCPSSPGSGALAKVGTGTLTLSGINTYTGLTTIDGGTLAVNGSILSSSGVIVNAAGTLGGTGVVPSVTINGGKLAPGNSIGTLTIGGNLTFVGAGNYLVEVSGTTTDRTNVAGTATLSGTVTASFLPGGALPGHYTILSAGARSGTFGTFTTENMPAALSASVSYTPSEVVLNITSAIALVPGLNPNQSAVAAALDPVFNAGTVPSAFVSLFGLSTAALPGALTQLSGEIATGSATAGFQSMDQFLNLMLDPFLETRFGDGSVQGRALGFAPESAMQTALPPELLGYNSLVTKAPPMPERRWTMWGAAFGGAATLKGDAFIGSNNLTVRGGSFAAGIDYRFSPDTVIGVAVAGGTQSFNLDGATASGRSDAVQGGVYGSTRAGNAYLSAALAYGRHDVSTDRNVAFGAVFDRLSASFGADSFGGRLEAGYRFAAANLGITPYAAVQALRFVTPSYGETDRTGLPAFALNYLGRAWNDTRSEAGARVDYRMMMDHGSQLTLRARAAWAHDFDTDRAIFATFQTLPGAGFSVFGATPAVNAALVSAGAELKYANGIALRAKFDGEFAGRSNFYGATGGLYVTW